MSTDNEAKKTFLQQSSALYNEMIRLTNSDVVRRYLAFRIIVNSMSFEDLIRARNQPRFREIRDVLLAHKQEPESFEGYRAADEITDQSVAPLIGFMNAETNAPDVNWLLPELVGGASRTKFLELLAKTLKQYENDNLGGFRVINNFLCHTGTAVQEVSRGPLAGVFYRYNSSKALFDLAQYIYNNTYQDSDLKWISRHAKLDMLLHAQNMADCAIKDRNNQYSIDGLLEVMTNEPIGNPASLAALVNDAGYQAAYAAVRKIRNKLIGHMDSNSPLGGLTADLDALPTTVIHDLVNRVDKAVYDAARSHPAIWARYSLDNQNLNSSQIQRITADQAKAIFLIRLFERRITSAENSNDATMIYEFPVSSCRARQFARCPVQIARLSHGAR